ncbi:VOC family protein [Breoghania sp. L-A4]|uniref:VOC family protein n=1 Tax=Breoghania sp. L-A4 TaxID=2304600 RepID=UPI000E360980|nr:VOC family protein [Breoghania sp. L-A4]AXS40027.1 VOC family protein [Breoghania sp. L-A4]
MTSASKPFTPDHFTVWTEIPVTDMDKAIAFYGAVFKTELKVDDTGPNPIAIFPTTGTDSVAGHLYPGKPAARGEGPTIHLACPDALEQTMDRLHAAGGTVLSDPITIPPGRFAYCQDPDGNSIGLFESARMAKTIDHAEIDRMQDA